METNCASLVADLFLFCYERDFMKSLSREIQAAIIEAFNSTSRYLETLLNVDNIHFEQIVDRIYPAELQLNNLILRYRRAVFGFELRGKLFPASSWRAFGNFKWPGSSQSLWPLYKNESIRVLRGGGTLPCGRLSPPPRLLTFLGTR